MTSESTSLVAKTGIVGREISQKAYFQKETANIRTKD